MASVGFLKERFSAGATCALEVAKQYTGLSITWGNIILGLTYGGRHCPNWVSMEELGTGSLWPRPTKLHWFGFGG